MHPSRARSVARLLERELRERVVPYWSGLVDRRWGGFLLADAEGLSAGWVGRWALGARGWLRPLGGTAPSPFEKHLVGQSRMVYALSLASRLGYDADGSSLAAAAQGCRFLVERLGDPAGGFVWTADRRGRPVVRVKLLYGHAFALLALVEHHRASGEAWALDRARQVFALIEERFADRAAGGWLEHLTAELAPWEGDLPAAARRGRPGWRSHDALLHLVEALAELCAASHEPVVEAALRRALAAAGEFLPQGDRPGRALRGGVEPDDPAAFRIVYGHRFEHAWLTLRAADALGEEWPWERFLRLVARTLADGVDAVRGGVLKAGRDGGPAEDGLRESWAQAEGLVALAFAARAEARFDEPFERQLAWVLERHRTRSGAWRAAVDGDGIIIDRTLAGSWKAGYHEVRALAFTARLLRGDAAPWR